jgi:peptidyl-prolyl cis-trans isomerase SurA
MKQILFFYFAILLFSTLQAQQKTVDRIVAVVDNEIILESELTAQVDFFVFNNRLDPHTPDLKKQVLDGMIVDKLILAQAIVESVVVSDAEVQQQLDDIIRQRAAQMGSEKKLEEMYGMSVAKIKIEFRNEVRKQLLSQRLQQMKFGKNNLSRSAVERFYTDFKDSLPTIPEEVELAHIYVVPKPSKEVKIKSKLIAQTILDSIKNGGDFADFAGRYSADGGSASSGGDLGFVRRGQFVKEFEEACFALKENEFAPIVETQFGLHIIQLLHRRGDEVNPRHILFPIGKAANDDSAAIAFLSSLQDSLAAGKTFAELARKYSEDKETAFTGGLLGTSPLAQIDEATRAILDTMKTGEVSAPLTVTAGGNSGFHILLLKNKTQEHQANLQDDWKRIEQLALNYKRSVEYKAWVEQLKKTIYWETRF